MRIYLLVLIFVIVLAPGVHARKPFGPPPTPSGLRAAGYDSHVELRWHSLNDATVINYRIYRSTDNGASFQLVASASQSDTILLDWVRPLGTTLNLQYRITSRNGIGEESPPTAAATATVRPFSDEELLTMVQAYTFRYFWDFAHPKSGLIRERNTSGDVVTMGGTGFGIMALLVGIERGFVTREQVRSRLVDMVFFLERADRFRGAFPHWMNGATGRVSPFSRLDDGGDIVETAFLFEGLLTARQYFNTDHPDEEFLREKITQLYQEIDWNWYRKQFQNVITWHWSPQHQFAINLPVRGWNETMMVYLLAIASPTKPVPPGLWDKGWASEGAIRYGGSNYGIRLPLGYGMGGPLFFTHYSFLGFDPRYRRDKYASYWEQNRNQTLINLAYCIANPRRFAGYSAEGWGITASDDPNGYLAHAPGESTDNGTLTPSAALSSMPYTPEESMAALRHFYRNLGDRIWGPMGFYDAFNPTRNWYADSYLAIDQGPIIGMIENHRSGLLWDLFMSSPEIQNALNAIGFTPDSIPVTGLEILPEGLSLRLFPNPARHRARLELNLEKGLDLGIDLIDPLGRRLQTVYSYNVMPAGDHVFELPVKSLPPGIYSLQLRHGGKLYHRKIIVQP